MNGIVGMRQGETKRFNVSPADGYGYPDASLIINQSRYYNMSVFEEVPMAYFASQNASTENGTVFPTQIGYVGVENSTEDTVTVRYLLSPGHKFVMSGLPQPVVNVSNDTMLIRFDVVQGGIYAITTQYTGAQSQALATYVDNETIVLDQNSQLAGKTLEFEVALRSLTK